MLPWLDADSPFPPLDTALRDPNGLLAAGGELTPSRLLNAYQQGIFPWFSAGDPVLWWSPDPRMVLVPDEFKLSRSLHKKLRRQEFEITTDTAFCAVIQACASAPRAGQNGTWIVDDIINAYSELHQLGHAHSVECWLTDKKQQRQLVGGLYGVCLGRMFYGESMFSRATDASKVAFAHLVRWLQENRVELIDCQMKTDHLASLGAREIPRKDFSARLEVLQGLPEVHWIQGPWTFDWSPKAPFRKSLPFILPGAPRPSSF